MLNAGINAGYKGNSALLASYLRARSPSGRHVAEVREVAQDKVTATEHRIEIEILV